MEPGNGRPFPPVEGVEVSHRYVNARGLNIHVAEAGGGEPLVMLHGWPQNWWMWRKQIPYFAPYYRVIVPDLRGFGWTDAPREGYFKENLSRDLVALAEALGYRHFRLLSHDWGGWIGYITCVRSPGLITQHFAANIPPLWPRVSFQMIPAALRFAYMLQIATPILGPRMLNRDGHFVRDLLTKGDTRPGGWTEFETSVFSTQFHEPSRARAAARLYRSFLFTEFISAGLFRRYKKKHMTTPTRLLFGANDHAIALGWLRGYESHFGDFLIELVPRAGHFIVDERPDLVNERALKFFRDPRLTPHR